ncbi:MAG: hypothetical protein WC546_02760 [Candidatus Omnitrophota bacterium]
MSIIYEALKKVEAQTNDNAFHAKQLSPKINNGDRHKPEKISLPFYLLIAVCTVSTILITINTYFYNREPRLQILKEKEIIKAKSETLPVAETIVAKTKAEIPNPQKPLLVVNKPAVDIKNLPAYNLQGIVYDKNSPFAIINGKTLRKSEAIDDFVIIDIAPTVVTLKNPKNDKELTLSF